MAHLLTRRHWYSLHLACHLTGDWGTLYDCLLAGALHFCSWTDYRSSGQLNTEFYQHDRQSQTKIKDICHFFISLTNTLNCFSRILWGTALSSVTSMHCKLWKYLGRHDLVMWVSPASIASTRASCMNMYCSSVCTNPCLWALMCWRKEKTSTSPLAFICCNIERRTI